MTNSQINLFLSYARADAPYFNVFNDEFKKVLKNSKDFNWNVWSDTNIHAGDFWDDTIQKNIQNCNVAILLVSISFMASRYIQEREYKEFLKRYADKGILIVPVVFKPCDFNAWPDLGKLQFFKPDGSNYEKPNLKDFTYSDLIKFSETDRSLIPNPNIDRYHLDLVNKVEGAYSEFLKNQTISTSILTETPTKSNINLLSDYPKPSLLFTGRIKEIEEFKKNFESNRIFAIEGLGGTGKTEFASKCIEGLIKDKNKIIWLNGSAQSNFDVFVESAGYGDVLKGEKKSDLALYSGFKDLIEKDERIIFWDNFNDYGDSAFSSFLSFAYKYLEKATIVLITKTEPLIEKITSLSVIRLEGLDSDAITYARRFRDSNQKYSSISEADLEKICKGVDGHPLAIEFSMSLMAYGKTVDDLIQHIGEYSGIKKVEEFSKRLFLDIYNHPQTTDEERACFLNCSVFKGAISEEAIKFMHQGKDVFYLLVGLIDKLLIVQKDGSYQMHPLVRSFGYEKLNDKKAPNKKVAEYFISKRTTDLNPLLEEKIFYHLSLAEEWETISDFIELRGKYFIHQGHLGLIHEFLNKVIHVKIDKPIFNILNGDIAQIQGKWDIAKEFYDAARQNQSNKNVKAEGMIKYAEILHRRGLVKEALPLYKEAYEFALTYNLIEAKLKVLNDLGLVHAWLGNLKEAQETLNESLRLQSDLSDLVEMADSFINLGLVYEKKGDNLIAKNKYEESLTINKQINNKVGIANSLQRLGMLENDYSQALKKFDESLKISIEIGDQEGIAGALINIGAISSSRGDLDDTLTKLYSSLRIYEEIDSISGLRIVFSHLGTILEERGDSPGAKSKYEQALKSAKMIEDKEGIAYSLAQLGDLSFNKRNLDTALEYYTEALQIFKEIEFKEGIGFILGDLGSLYEAKSDSKKALQYHQEALKLFEEMGDKKQIAVCYNNLGNAYSMFDDINESIKYYHKALHIHKAMGSTPAMCITLGNLGVAYANPKIKDFEMSLSNLFESASILNSIGYKPKYLDMINWIVTIRDKQLGLQKFKELAKKAYKKLDPDLQKFLSLKELMKEPIIQAEKKISRNDIVTVKYKDGSIKQNVKFKFVENDISQGKCEILK
jgi:tetratricopeptide (TPR) repeat protein